jgi:TolB-like protein
VDGQRAAITWQEVSLLKTAELTQKGAPAPPADNPIRLCVVPFKNLGNDPLQIGDALEEMVYTEMTENPGVKLVERGQIDVDIRLLDFDAKYADPATRAALGRLTGAEVALLGGYQVNGKALRVTARFIHVQTGEVLQAFRLDGTTSEAMALEERVAHKAREAVAAVHKRLRP